MPQHRPDGLIIVWLISGSLLRDELGRWNITPRDDNWLVDIEDDDDVMAVVMYMVFVKIC